MRSVESVCALARSCVCLCVCVWEMFASCEQWQRLLALFCVRPCAELLISTRTFWHCEFLDFSAKIFQLRSNSSIFPSLLNVSPLTVRCIVCSAWMPQCNDVCWMCSFNSSEFFSCKRRYKTLQNDNFWSNSMVRRLLRSCGNCYTNKSCRLLIERTENSNEKEK